MCVYLFIFRRNRRNTRVFLKVKERNGSDLGVGSVPGARTRLLLNCVALWVRYCIGIRSRPRTCCACREARGVRCGAWPYRVFTEFYEAATAAICLIVVKSSSRQSRHSSTYWGRGRNIRHGKAVSFSELLIPRPLRQAKSRTALLVSTGPDSVVSCTHS